MNMLVRIAIGLFIVASATDTVSAAGQQSRAPAAAAKKVKTQGVLTVPTAGTFAADGQFTGTISINRFERRGNDIIAIGMVAGAYQHRRFVARQRSGIGAGQVDESGVVA